MCKRRGLKGESLPSILREVDDLTKVGGVEHAIVSQVGGGRSIVSGGPGGIVLDDSIRRVILHTHPYHAPRLFGPSADDLTALGAFGQRSSYLMEHGTVVKFWRNGSFGPDMPIPGRL